MKHGSLLLGVVSIRKLPLPLRERDRVRGMKIESINILGHYHPHPDPPPSRGRGKSEFPDGNYLVFPFVVSLSNHKKILLQEPQWIKILRK
jgi:hypothetical protein